MGDAFGSIFQFPCSLSFRVFMYFCVDLLCYILCTTCVSCGYLFLIFILFLFYLNIIFWTRRTSNGHKIEKRLVCMTSRIPVRCPIHWTIFRRMYLDQMGLWRDSHCRCRTAEKKPDRNVLGKITNKRIHFQLEQFCIAFGCLWFNCSTVHTSSFVVVCETLHFYLWI